MDFLSPVSSIGYAGPTSPLGSVFAPGSACSRCVGGGAEAATAGLLQQQASLNAMMQGLLMLLLTLMLGRGGGASPLGGLAGGAASPSGGGAAGGVGGGGGGGGAAPADASQIQGGTAIGRRLAKEALQESTDGDSPGGLCARDVKTALRQVGIQLPLGDAWKMAEPLAKHPKFREVKVSKSELSKLPPGAIVVWDKGAGLPYGHISIALGDGREASDRLRKQMLLNTSFRVFMPLD